MSCEMNGPHDKNTQAERRDIIREFGIVLLKNCPIRHINSVFGLSAIRNSEIKRSMNVDLAMA